MWYRNGTGKLLYVADLPLEPSDCWGPEITEEDEDLEDSEDPV